MGKPYLPNALIMALLAAPFNHTDWLSTFGSPESYKDFLTLNETTRPMATAMPTGPACDALHKAASNEKIAAGLWRIGRVLAGTAIGEQAELIASKDGLAGSVIMANLPGMLFAPDGSFVHPILNKRASASAESKLPDANLFYLHRLLSLAGQTILDRQDSVYEDVVNNWKTLGCEEPDARFLAIGADPFKGAMEIRSSYLTQGEDFVSNVPARPTTCKGKSNGKDVEASLVWQTDKSGEIKLCGYGLAIVSKPDRTPGRKAAQEALESAGLAVKAAPTATAPTATPTDAPAPDAE